MKSLRRIVGVLLVFVLFVSINEIYALGGGFNKSIFNDISGGAVDQGISNTARKVYATISLIIKAVAVIGVVYTGVRYMTASASDKGVIKQTLIYVVIGTVFVFAADAVINLVIRTGNEIIS